uniref:Uncharacterized protein n=1 Tax=Opuntia streptacantha TaxID=393608 RepID=A0A7C9ASY0_OPUST
MRGHKKLGFSSPNMRLSHVTNISVKLIFQIPFSIFASFNKLLNYLLSEFISKFFLTTLIWRWLPFPATCTMGHGPKQTSAISRYTSDCECGKLVVKRNSK